SRRRHTRWPRDWSSDVCSSDLFKNAIGFVLCLRLVGVNVCAHLAVHGLYGRTPQEPVAERDPVAAQIHESPTPAAIHVPEPGGRSEERRVGKEGRWRWAKDDVQ